MQEVPESELEQVLFYLNFQKNAYFFALDVKKGVASRWMLVL